MKNRRILNFILALALLFLAACEKDSTSPSPSASSSLPSIQSPSSAPSEAPGTAQFVLPYDPNGSLHPLTSQSQLNLTLAPLVYEGLFELDETFTPHPLLCKDCTISSDALEWTFTLQSALFSDGSALTAEDVVHSLLLARDSSSYSSRFRLIHEVRAEENAVVIALTAPHGNLPALLDIPIVRETDGGLPLGTGPYALSLAGAECALTANPFWWQAIALPASSIPLCSVESTDDLIRAFNTQAVSLVTTDLTGSNSPGYSGSCELWDYPTSVMLYVGYNTASGPCADVEVRRALTYGYDRTSIVRDSFSQYAQAAALPFSPASSLYHSALANLYPFAPQTMASELNKAGWVLSDGVRTKGTEALALTLLVNTDNASKLSAAQAIVQSLADCGIAAELKALPWSDYVKALAAGEFDLYLGEVRLTADFDLTSLLSPDGALNYGHFSDPDAQELLSAFLAADDSRRGDAADRLCRQLYRTVPFTPLCFKTRSVLTHWGRLTGLKPTQSNPFRGLAARGER